MWFSACHSQLWAHIFKRAPGCFLSRPVDHPQFTSSLEPLTMQKLIQPYIYCYLKLASILRHITLHQTTFRRLGTAASRLALYIRIKHVIVHP